MATIAPVKPSHLGSVIGYVATSPTGDEVTYPGAKLLLEFFNDQVSSVTIIIDPVVASVHLPGGGLVFTPQRFLTLNAGAHGAFCFNASDIALYLNWLKRVSIAYVGNTGGLKLRALRILPYSELGVLPDTLQPPLWAPSNVDVALNFMTDEYWSRSKGYIGNPLSVVRATPAWRTGPDGESVKEFPSNVLRRDARGAYIEGYARLRLSMHPGLPANWQNVSPNLVRMTLAPEGMFTPQQLERPVGGSSSSQIADSSAGFQLTLDEDFALRALLKFGTSGRFRAALRRLSVGATVSVVSGNAGGFAATSTGLGTFTNIQLLSRSFDTKELLASLKATATPSPGDVRLEVGPDAAADGQTAIVMVCQLTREKFAGELLFGNLAGQFTQPAEKASTTSFPGMKTISVDFDLISYPSGAVTCVIWHYGGGSTYARLVYDVVTGKLLAQAFVGGVQQCSLDLGVIAIGASHVVTFAWADNDFAASIDGAAPVTDGIGTAPTGLAQFILGQNAAGAEGSAILPRKVRMFANAIDPETV